MTSTAVVREYRQFILAPPQQVFPLLCPVREGEWADGWAEHCRLVSSRTGYAEPGCVFVTSQVGRPDTTWVITRHDPGAGVVEFCRVCPGVEAVTLAIGVSEATDGSTVDIRYAAVPLPGADLDAFEASWDPSALASDLRWWQDSMNHHLATGGILRPS